MRRCAHAWPKSLCQRGPEGLQRSGAPSGQPDPGGDVRPVGQAAEVQGAGDPAAFRPTGRGSHRLSRALLPQGGRGLLPYTAQHHSRLSGAAGGTRSESAGVLGAICSAVSSCAGVDPDSSRCPTSRIRGNADAPDARWPRLKIDAKRMRAPPWLARASSRYLDPKIQRWIWQQGWKGYAIFRRYRFR